MFVSCIPAMSRCFALLKESTVQGRSCGDEKVFGWQVTIVVLLQQDFQFVFLLASGWDFCRHILQQARGSTQAFFFALLLMHCFKRQQSWESELKCGFFGNRRLCFHKHLAAALQPGKWLVTVFGASADAGVIGTNIFRLAVRFLKW